MLSWPPKDPDEILEYQVDWTERLESETIASSAWSLVAGDVTIMTDSPNEPEINGAFTKVWLSGGTDATEAQIGNRIVTSAGRTRDITIKLKIKAK